MIITSNVSLALVLLLAKFVLHVTCLHHNQVHDNPRIINGDRETLEIIIGGGGSYSPPPTPPNYQDCPPPPPPPPLPPPSPPPFESKRIEIVYPIIQKFKQKIKHDPYGITKTWVGHDICNNYKGFFCDILSDYGEKVLAGVIFNGFNFDGPDLNLNGFIDELPDIIVFHANSNNFKGSFPLKISKIKYLYELDLSNNKYSCEFPYEVLGATRLTFLDLRFNKFSEKATLFDASRNFLTGPIPKSFACLGRMEILNLADNQLYGPVPVPVCKLPNLRNLSLSYNYFTKVGPECWKLIKKKVLDVRMNCIPGLPAQRSPAQCHAFFSKAKTCAEENSSDWVSCNGNIRRKSLESSNSERISTYSYAALDPHRL
ncbi:hypothetical protein DH2020_006632 [Rehmannia glutinosa]|uniref:Uncharacterized protein n=1 Tax=Rehmannia glutinosa TaxID=99300 RepID=A0ABR0XJH9_REHGL